MMLIYSFILLFIGQRCYGHFMDCESRRCCSSLKLPYNNDIECELFGLSECIANINYCEWSCNSISNDKNHKRMINGGYTTKKFRQLSKGNGKMPKPRNNYNQQSPKDFNSEKKMNDEPQSVEEFIKYTSITSVDECGVEYEYNMDENTARMYLEKRRAEIEEQRLKDNDAYNSNSKTKQTNKLIRRLEVFGSDGRKQVNNIWDKQWSGMLYTEDDNFLDNGICSAALIKKNYAITAGHCIYYTENDKDDWSKADYISGIAFHPGTVNVATFSTNIIYIKKMWTFTQWIDDKDWSNDIAWLELNTDVGNDVGYISLGYIEKGTVPNVPKGFSFPSLPGFPNMFPDLTANNIDLNIVGYPGDKPTYTKWYQKQCTVNNENNVLKSTDCDIWEGSSGSPVYTNGYDVVGIVSYYQSGGDAHNGFARITAANRDTICNSIGGCPSSPYCEYKVKDYLGTYWCPDECRNCIVCSTGTCEGLFGEGHWCNVHEDCKGHGLGLSDMACCDGKCKKKSGGWCPGKAIGESCNLHTDCDGWGPGARDVACCKGKCAKKKKDWAGVGYCPHECKDCAWCKAGSC